MTPDTPSTPPRALQIIPLGGLGEFGMNMMVIRYGDAVIVVDAGLMFPEDRFHGVDFIVPDMSYHGLQPHLIGNS